MLKSMTSFGRGQAPFNDGFWQVELRCVNSRYLDCHFKLPFSLTALEERIKKHLSASLTRGRVNLIISLSGAVLSQPRLVLNRPLLSEYQRILDELSRELGGVHEVSLSSLLNNRDLVLAEENAPDLEELWLTLLPALDQALAESDNMRQAEGQALAEDLYPRLQKLEGLFNQVAACSDRVVEEYRSRLQERISRLLDGPEPNQERLAMEVAVMADKCDITEEAVRAVSHLNQFRGFLESSEPVGRKLDFLTQELNREANTMGSKTPDAQVAKSVVEMKTEIERIREQIQNIE